jgi:zinc protease
MKKLLMSLGIFVCALTMIWTSCSKSSDSGKSFEIEFEKYVLNNGLEVVLHEDHSDPIVAVATVVHVGSQREKPGRTGFAHLFEHISFNDSENVPRGANRKLIPELGGLRNGGTWWDGTIYYEVVPKDAFEKILWIDSDRLGFIINTVTKEALEREKQVVKNEKRQIIDNLPYGHTDEVIRANLYPEGHPYSWTVIGSLPDLQAATLEDVREFYDQYYGANNCTLAIAGDIDIEETKVLVEKWFGEIRRSPEAEPLPAMPAVLSESRSLYYEDSFAKLPELRLVFPTVEIYHPDSYALDVLAEILSGSKIAPLYKVIVDEKKLASRIDTSQNSYELAGEFVFRVRAQAGIDLDDVYAAILEGFSRFEQTGLSDNELLRIKALEETQLYNRALTVLNKARLLSQYNEYAGNPGYISVEASRMQNVTREDVMAVYEKYIKEKFYVMTSVVPKGHIDLIVQDSEPAEVYVEPFSEGESFEQVSQGPEAVYEKTVTQHDRSEPPLDEPPLQQVPLVWTGRLNNGLKVYGIENDEVPLVTFDFTLKGGHWLDPIEKAGIANLLINLMMQGTKNRTPAELEEAIGLLGSNISMNASSEEIIVSASTLARNFETTLDLVEEILLEPRWDISEYERLKKELEMRLMNRASRPDAIASLVVNRLLYGNKHIFGTPTSGTLETTSRIMLEDLKRFYDTNFSPSIASFHLVGNVDKSRVKDALSDLDSRWPSKKVTFPEYSVPKESRGGKVYFVDIPGARQSIILIAKLTLSAQGDDYNNLSYANLVLGAPSSGRLLQLLRIEKGYTYGAFSSIGSGLEIVPFLIYASVRNNITLESLRLIRGLLEDYKSTFTQREVDVTKNMVIKDNTRAFESLDAKLEMLHRMSKYDLPSDFIVREQNELISMTLEDFHYIIDKYMNEDEMFYLVVGDGKAQLQRMEEFGYGDPVVLDIHGKELKLRK